ncbi:MAG: dienelactone hydrolase family protein [Burkholderiales bacterium]|nr:dienelactone hydrolase family protein [Burkholderiales bacterium]
MRYELAALSFSLLLAASAEVCAQITSARLLAASTQAKDLDFPTEVSRLSVLSYPRMALYKPEGQGPFPALVLHHQCGGLSRARWQNVSMLNWAKEAVARGYVALLIDSLGPRGVDTVCMGPRGGVNLMRGVKDALQAAEHLRQFDFVDKSRIALAGYSWGAMVGVAASSKLWGNTLSPGERFAAVVSFYPGCFTIRPSAGAAYEIVNTDIDRPLLVLLGEKDTETPAAACVAKLAAAQAAGAPVQWHVYPNVTHCWDCVSLDGFSKVDARGNRVVYYYDDNATKDAARRMFDFLQTTLAARP